MEVLGERPCCKMARMGDNADTRLGQVEPVEECNLSEMFSKNSTPAVTSSDKSIVLATLDFPLQIV
jgi:hypothetical protein